MSKTQTVQQPEDLLLAWLILLPDNADIALEAQFEISRLDRRASSSPFNMRLLELLREVAGSSRKGSRTPGHRLTDN